MLLEQSDKASESTHERDEHGDSRNDDCLPPPRVHFTSATILRVDVLVGTGTRGSGENLAMWGLFQALSSVGITMSSRSASSQSLSVSRFLDAHAYKLMLTIGILDSAIKVFGHVAADVAGHVFQRRHSLRLCQKFGIRCGRYSVMKSNSLLMEEDLSVP